MDNQKRCFDVIISGGGLSGSLMALSLSKLTKKDGSLLSIAIVEALPYQKTIASNDDNLFDARVLALSHGSASYIKKLGAWPFLVKKACAITNIDISDRGHFAKTRLTAKEHGVNALGYVVDLASIGKANLQTLTTHNKLGQNIHWFSPDSIEKIAWHNEFPAEFPEHKSTDTSQVQVKLSSGNILSASLLLACDGVQSPCRNLANIEVSCEDYGQVALIANVTTSQAHQNKAFERFTNHGPIAMLPLSAIAAKPNESRCSLVWTMTPEDSEKITQLNDEDFKLALEDAFGRYLGEISYVGKRYSYPLVLLQAKQQTHHRMALIGNASHTIHPIAGQGFNLGLRDVQVMAQLVASALKNNQDIGSFALLNAYQENREKDHREIIQLTDSLVTLFANDLPPLIVGRNIGLQALNFLSPFKGALVKKTMGY
jgi:2-octaprenyl-6-methoxyphenol hydroxylase